MNSEIDNVPVVPKIDRRKQPKRPDVTTDELARLYFQEWLPVKKIGNKFGISQTSVAYRLRRAGYTLRPWKGGKKLLPISMEELVRLYFQDELSSLAISKKLNVCDETIRRRLRKAGHILRTNDTAQQVAKMRMEPIERRLIYGGVIRAGSMAKSREKSAQLRKKIAPSERRFMELASVREFPSFVQQRAVGIYNMDFATDTVGIEIIGGRSNPHNFASSAERIYFILKSGFHLIELLYREPLDPFKDAAIDKIVSFLEVTKTLPPHIREYRMIGGSGQLLAVFQTDLNNAPRIEASSREMRIGEPDKRVI